MRTVNFILLCVAVIVALAGCNPHPTQTKNEAIAVRRVTATEEFDLRTKCYALGQQMENDNYGMVGNALTSETNTHYNPDTNRCYVQFTATKNFATNYPSTPTNYLTSVVYDGQTRTMLVFADQEGDNSHGVTYYKLPDSDMQSITYDAAQTEIHKLMQGEEN